MPKAIRIHKQGGPDVLNWEDVQVGDPAAGQIRVRHTAVGLNYIDTYQRSGLYPMPMPATLGMEAAGIIEAVGPGVAGLRKGDHVAYSSQPGAYSEVRLAAADKVVKVPRGVSDQDAAAMMLKGMTAQYLIRQIYKVKAGDTILIHAAAGGVGLIVCQWAKSLGATVIGTVSTPAKAQLARENGCDHPIITTQENFVEQVAKITKGAKLPVVYDSVGKDTFEGSLDCLRPMGLLVSFGQSSGSIAPVNLGVFAQKGSLFFTRPSLMNYTATRAQLETVSKDLFKAVKSGAVKIRIDQTYALKDTRKAHEDLEGRKTTGQTILIP